MCLSANEPLNFSTHNAAPCQCFSRHYAANPVRQSASQPVKQCYSRGDSSRVVHMSVCRPDRHHHHQSRVLIMSLYLLLSSSGTPFTNVFGLFSFLPNPILTAGWMAHSISLLSNPIHVDYRSVERSSRQDRSLAICCCPSPQDSIYLLTTDC